MRTRVIVPPTFRGGYEDGINLRLCLAGGKYDTVVCPNHEVMQIVQNVIEPTSFAFLFRLSRNDIIPWKYPFTFTVRLTFNAGIGHISRQYGFVLYYKVFASLTGLLKSAELVKSRH